MTDINPSTHQFRPRQALPNLHLNSMQVTDELAVLLQARFKMFKIAADAVCCGTCLNGHDMMWLSFDSVGAKMCHFRWHIFGVSLDSHVYVLTV